MRQFIVMDFVDLKSSPKYEAEENTLMLAKIIVDSSQVSVLLFVYNYSFSLTTLSLQRNMAVKEKEDQCFTAH